MRHVIVLILIACAPATEPIAQAYLEYQVNMFVPGNQEYPAVAARQDLLLTFVWQTPGQDGSGYGIYARHLWPDGTPADDEFQVNTNAAGDQLYPAVACNDNGLTVIVWQTPAAGASETLIAARLYDATGQPVTGEFYLAQQAGAWQERPVVGMDAAGNFTAAWCERGLAVPPRIQLRRFDASGQPVTGVITAADLGSASYQSDVRLAVDDQGRALAAFVSGNSLGWENRVYLRAFAADGTPLTEPVLASAEANEQTVPAVSWVDAAHGAVAFACAGGSCDGAGDVRVGVFPIGQAPVELWAPQEYAVGQQGLPAVAGDDGHVAVAWTSWDDRFDVAEVYGRRFLLDGTTLTPEYRINQETLLYQGRPYLHFMPGGDYTATWESMEQDDDQHGVFALLFPRSTSPTPTPIPPSATPLPPFLTPEPLSPTPTAQQFTATPSPTSAPGTPTPTATPPCYTNTPQPGTATATPTPASSPGTATPRPEPTPTAGCPNTGATLWMPATAFSAGDPCELRAYLCNAGSPLICVRLLVCLDIAGSYWFGPRWRPYPPDLDFWQFPELPPGTTQRQIIPRFSWPADVPPISGIRFWAALTDEQMSGVLGEIGFWEFQID